MGRADDVLARALRDSDDTGSFVVGRDAPAPRTKKRGAGWLKALASLRTSLRGMSRLKDSKAPLRALMRGGRYSDPIARDQAGRMDCYTFHGEGRRTRAYLTLAGYVSKSTREALREADAKALALREAFDALGKLPVEDALLGFSPLELPHEGWNLGPLLDPALRALFGEPQAHRFENAFATSTARTIETVLMQVVQAEFMLERSEPDVVLLTHDSLDLDLALVEVARKRGCPTAVLQHGAPAAYFPQRADRFFAWGPGVGPIYELSLIHI